MNPFFPPIPGVQPCRFCGETEHLMVQEGMDELMIHNPDGSIARDPDGSVATEWADFIQCWSCDAMAPVRIWNGAVVTPAEKAALAAYYLSDEAVQEAA